LKYEPIAPYIIEINVFTSILIEINVFISILPFLEQETSALLILPTLGQKRF